MSDGQSLHAPKGIALFDLDGTLIAWDCQILFRHFILRREPWRRIFLPVFLAFLPLTPLLGAGGMKRIFLSYLHGMSGEKLDVYSREFAKAVMPAIYPEGLEFMARHRAAGDLLVLASASPEFYVKYIGQELGFDLSLGTPVEVGASCAFFPDLENHKGAAKVRRLRELLSADRFDTNGILIGSHGYTDSTADLPMLAICANATVVNPSPILEQKAENSGWAKIRPLRPWSSFAGYAWLVFKLLNGIGKDPGSVYGSNNG